MKKLLSTLAFIGILMIPCFAQFSLDWQKTIGGIQAEFLTNIQPTADNGYIAVGYSQSNISGDKTEGCLGGRDYWIVKMNNKGGLLWQNTIGGSIGDYAWKVLELPGEGYLVGGYSNSGITGDKTLSNLGSYDFWVMKVNHTGGIVWQKTMGGNQNDRLYDMVATPDGGFLLAGASNSPISGNKTLASKGLHDYWLVKISSIGDIQWEKTYGGLGEDYLYTLQATPDGGYILGGESNSLASGDKTVSFGNYDYWVVKISSTGMLEWEKTFGGNQSDNLHALWVTPTGEIVIGGESRSNMSGNKSQDVEGDTDYWVLKLSAIGNILWQKNIGGDQTDVLRSISATSDGGYILGGTSNSNISGLKGENSRGDFDYWMLKMDDAGNIVWQRTMGGNAADYLYQVVVDSDESLLLAGTSSSNISGEKTDPADGQSDYWILKMKQESLPVILLGFEGENREGVAYLEWTTSREENNHYFEIERSSDNKNFEPLGIVYGSGNSETEQRYSFIDDNPRVMNYYRLKQVDYDGDFAYTYSVEIQSEIHYMRAYPNPADNILTIECLDIGYFDLYDIVGTLVTSITVEGYAQMDVSLLPPGMYELVNRKANKRGQKIMIQ